MMAAAARHSQRPRSQALLVQARIRHGSDFQACHASVRTAKSVSHENRREFPENCQLGLPAAIRVYSSVRPMTPASPEFRDRPLRPAPETWALRAEWRAEPPSLARAQADGALDALSRVAADGTKEPPVDEVPPVPEKLRARWAEVYGQAVGEATGVAPRPQAPTPEVPSNVRPATLSDWLGSLLRPRRLAWTAGLAGAVALVAAMLSQHDGTGTIAGGSSNNLATRGANGTPPPPPARIILIDSPATTAVRDELLALLRQAFPTRPVQVVGGIGEAAAAAESEARLVVVNLQTGRVTAWQNGELAEEFHAPAEAGASEIVGRVESADESFDRDPGPVR